MALFRTGLLEFDTSCGLLKPTDVGALDAWRPRCDYPRLRTRTGVSMQSVVVDLNHVRLKRQARSLEFCQVVALMKLFWTAHLRFAHSVPELVDWARSMFPAGVEINPSTVLSEDELEAATVDGLQERARDVTEHVLGQLNISKLRDTRQ